MNRREFYKTGGALGLGLLTGKSALAAELNKLKCKKSSCEKYNEYRILDLLI